MQQDRIKEIFDRMAEGYDAQWERLGALNGALHLLVGGIFAGLPERARILCVGAGTGAEILHFAARFPQWTFTALDPSSAMLDVCKRRLAGQGFEDRCDFHVGYLDSFAPGAPYDAATSLLVSQFITAREERVAFFRRIAGLLKPGGILVDSDLSAQRDSASYRSLLEAWFNMMKSDASPVDGLERMKEAYDNEVAVLPEREVAEIIAAGGFSEPIHFFQVGLVHAWYASKAKASA